MKNAKNIIFFPVQMRDRPNKEKLTNAKSHLLIILKGKEYNFTITFKIEIYLYLQFHCIFISGNTT